MLSQVNNLLPYDFNSMLYYVKSKYGNQIALCDESYKISFGEMEKIIYLWKDFFELNGIQNETIILEGRLSVDWFLTFWGIVCSGNVALLYDSIVLDKMANNITSKELYICGDIDSSLKEEFNSKFIDYAKINKQFKSNLQNVKSTDKLVKRMTEQVAVKAYSSGTTARPKCIELTQGNVISDILHCKNIFGDIFGQDDLIVPILPSTHMFGLTVALLIPMFYGAQICFVGNNENEFNAILRAKPTTLVLVPTIIDSIRTYIEYYSSMYKLDKKEAIKKVFPNLRYIVCGSAFLRSDLECFFDDTDVLIMNGYGTTECSPVVACNNVVYRKRKSVGKLVDSPYCSVNIINNEIVVSGEIVSKGCCKDIAGCKYFFTGDLGYIDEEGFLFVTGRKDNLIVLDNGYKVEVDEIEQMLLEESSYIKDVQVCLIYDEVTKQEILSAVIVADWNKIGTEKEIYNAIENVNKKLSKYKQIRKIIKQTNDFEQSKLYKRMARRKENQLGEK